MNIVKRYNSTPKFIDLKEGDTITILDCEENRSNSIGSDLTIGNQYEIHQIDLCSKACFYKGECVLGGRGIRILNDMEQGTYICDIVIGDKDGKRFI